MTFGVSHRDPGQPGVLSSSRDTVLGGEKTVPVNNSEGKAPRGFARSPWRQITESEDVYGLLCSPRLRRLPPLLCSSLRDAAVFHRRWPLTREG